MITSLGNASRTPSEGSAAHAGASTARSGLTTYGYGVARGVRHIGQSDGPPSGRVTRPSLR